MSVRAAVQVKHLETNIDGVGTLLDTVQWGVFDSNFANEGFSASSNRKERSGRVTAPRRQNSKNAHYVRTRSLSHASGSMLQSGKRSTHL